MQKHPDADAFVLEHLRHPANATTRLVFADWLEETGTPSNVAWAHYIRLREAAERHAPDSGRRPLLRQADEHAAKVRAKLALAGRVFARNPEAILRLLPAPNIVVRFGILSIPQAILELMPESVARENELLPLALCGNTLYCATTEPHNFETAEKLRFILNTDIVLTGGEQDDIQETTNRWYGQTEIEVVDSVLIEFADTASPFFPREAESDLGSEVEGVSDAPVVRLVDLILTEAVHLRADRILLYPDPAEVVVRYRIDDQWIERDRIPGRLMRPVFARFAILGGLFANAVFQEPFREEPLRGAAVLNLADSFCRCRITIVPSPREPTIQIDLVHQPVGPT